MPIRIPAPSASSVEVRVARLEDRDRFGDRWQYHALARSADGWWQADVGSLGLADGVHEYEFVLDGDRAHPIPDPFATEITKFGGYRGLLRVQGGLDHLPPFDWSDELPDGVTLAPNNEIVIYEMPMRWMEAEWERQVGLGTFEKAAFAHLDRLADMGINCIQLLPVQDSPDTLNWGYGTRFFFAPDIDMGTPVDLKWFVKKCHQRGIRVILDVVMNHARECALARLAAERYFITPSDEPGRGHDYGGQMFRYREKVDGQHWAREFHFEMARHWIEEYRVDGFRIDEFKGIDNWEFIQQFGDAARGAFRGRFPDRPFIVIAEDSWTRPETTQDLPTNPNRRKVVDAIWNFGFRDELRRLLLDDITTQWDQPPRRERIEAMVSGRAFDDLAQSVGYVTSHDVERDGERRFMNHVLTSLLRLAGEIPPDFPPEREFERVREVAEAYRIEPDGTDDVLDLYREALERVRSAHALLMTSVTIPMLLAGEEFADIHDTNHHVWQLKMSDPVDWYRQDYPGHRETAAAIRDLIWLRHGHPALHRNEVEFFHFHPEMDLSRADGGRRVFAYCRTAGAPLGSGGQVVVLANTGPHDYPQYGMPWPWNGWSERGARAGVGGLVGQGNGWADVSLAPFEVRVFETFG